MINIIPEVLVLAGEKFVYVKITKCDWCGKTLFDKKCNFKWDMVQIEDDAIRPMYFCSEECRSAFNVKYPRGKALWPGVKLRLDGCFVRLKEC